MSGIPRVVMQYHRSAARHGASSGIEMRPVYVSKHGVYDATEMLLGSARGASPHQHGRDVVFLIRRALKVLLDFAATRVSFAERLRMNLRLARQTLAVKRQNMRHVRVGQGDVLFMPAY